MVLLPFESHLVGVGLVGVEFDYSVDDLDLEFAGLAQQWFHDGAIPRGSSGGDVIEGFDLVEDWLFCGFEYVCNFAEFDLSIMLEDRMEGNILYFFESLSH